jgi:hypothetical protein
MLMLPLPLMLLRFAEPEQCPLPRCAPRRRAAHLPPPARRGRAQRRRGSTRHAHAPHPRPPAAPLRRRGALFALILANVAVAFLAEFLCTGIQWTVRRSQRGLKYRATQKAAAAMAAGGGSGGSGGAHQPAYL